MTKPNILLIMCDQLNSRVPDLLGGPVPMPNLARITDGGTVFHNAYCTSPICTPSRASLMTGLYPHGHGMTGNVFRKDYPALAAISPPEEQGINNQDITTEKILNAAGWETAYRGKWHLSGDDLDYFPIMYREHAEYPQECKSIHNQEKDQTGEILDWYGWKLPLDILPEIKRTAKNLDERLATSRLAEFYTKMGVLKLPIEDCYDWRVADKAVRYLQDNTAKPFMLTVSFNWPHDPNVVPAEYLQKVDPAWLQLNEGTCEEKFWADISRAVPEQMGSEFLLGFLKIYYACCLFIDDMIGKVLDNLEKSGGMENTLVVFVADHGDMAGGHGMFWKSTSAFYNEITRIPLIIRPPQRSQVSAVDSPVSITDIMPTILSACGLKVPAGIHGKNLLPLINGKKTDPDRAVLCERFNWNRKHLRRPELDGQGSYMLRWHNWTYMNYEDGKVYLYDLECDPGQNNNLVGESSYQVTLAEMHSRLQNHLDETGGEGKLSLL